jgi:hypothetical protein
METRRSLIVSLALLSALGIPFTAMLSAQTATKTPSMRKLVADAKVSSSFSTALTMPSRSAEIAAPTAHIASAGTDSASRAGTLALPVRKELGSNPILIQQVEVLAHESKPVTHPDDGVSLRVNSREVNLTAGAYNDIPKFLQTLPGVAFDTDSRNTYLVNGGNAMENLYVLNGVEIPNINHISSAGSSGGFVSLIDTDAVSSLTLHKQLYGSEHSGTLSSVLDIRTLEPKADKRHGEVSVGYAGAGFLLEQPIGHRGETMTQFRRSIVNYLTNDIGIDGVPKYLSLLSTATVALTENDKVQSLVVRANDNLDIRPNTLDSDDPGLVNTSYRGNRSTGAVTWHHMVSAGQRSTGELFQCCHQHRSDGRPQS